MAVSKVTDETKKVQKVLDEINKTRPVEYSENKDVITLTVEGVEVFRARKLKHCIHVEMLPDIFTYSNWANRIVVGTLHFNGKGLMCINLDLEECDMGDTLEIIKDAITDLNLYGYIIEK